MPSKTVSVNKIISKIEKKPNWIVAIVQNYKPIVAISRYVEVLMILFGIWLLVFEFFATTSGYTSSIGDKLIFSIDKFPNGKAALIDTDCTVWSFTSFDFTSEIRKRPGFAANLW